jgi:hypothetical protein
MLQIDPTEDRKKIEVALLLQGILNCLTNGEAEEVTRSLIGE